MRLPTTNIHRLNEFIRQYMNCQTNIDIVNMERSVHYNDITEMMLIQRRTYRNDKPENE